MTKSELKSLVQAFNAFYYNKGKSLLTDKEYDSLLAKAKSEDPNFNIFLYADADRDEVRHHVSFPYLKKYQLDKTDFNKMIKDNKWLKDMLGKGHLATPKLSGCSIVLYYKDGKLWDILTKSNDATGKRKMKALKDLVPHEVDRSIKCINCEAIVELDKGKGYGSEATANGLINSVHKPDEVASLITLVVWDIQIHGGDKLSLYNSLYSLQTDKFKVIEPIPADINKLAWDPEYHSREGLGKSVSSLVDGWVIYDKNHELKYALKFYYNQSADVTITKVEWNKSTKLGYIPKLCFDPVKLEHANVKQCASNGIMNMISKDIGVGSVIRVARVNSSSPQCIKVIKANGFKYPRCPRCKTELSKSDIIKSVIYCSNPLCQDKLDWVSSHVGNVTEDKFRDRTDKYTIDAMNLSNFDPKRKRTKKWSDEDKDKLIDAIHSNDSKSFLNMILSHFDINPDNKKSCKYMIDAVIYIISKKLQ